MIDAVAETAVRMGDESGDVSATAREQSVSLVEVSESAASLDERASELQDRLEEFTLREKTDRRAVVTTRSGGSAGEGSEDGPDPAGGPRRPRPEDF